MHDMPWSELKIKCRGLESRRIFVSLAVHGLITKSRDKF